MLYEMKRAERIAANLVKLHEIGNYLKGTSPEARRSYVLSLMTEGRPLEGKISLKLLEEMGAAGFSKRGLQTALYSGLEKQQKASDQEDFPKITATGSEAAEDIKRQLEKARRCFDELNDLGFSEFPL